MELGGRTTPPAEDSPPDSQLRLLILEDDPIDAELVVATLEQAGYACHWERVTNELTFRSRLAAPDPLPYDVVLADYNLPSFDGLRALQQLRTRDPEIPCIMVSGVLGEEIAIESMKAGATDYVLKSQIARLPAVLGRALREHAELRQRRRAEEALRNAEARYRDLFENANDIVYTLDIPGVFTSVNAAGERLFGYPREQLLQMNIRGFLAPESDALAQAYLAHKLSEPAETTTYEVEIIRPDGARLPLEVSTRLLFRDGQPYEVQGIARDISERRHAEAERRRLEEQLLQAQKMESIGTLAGGIAHDFNNLLTAILGNTQLAIEGLTPGSQDHELLVEIEQAARRAAALTNQLLAFSRRQRLERQAIDLNATMNELLNMLRRIIGEDVEIQLDLAPESPAVFADPAQIQQVVLNLAVNARDAMPSGGRLRIATRSVQLDATESQTYPWAQPGSYTQIVVSDNGAGMDDTIQQRIFEPFFTTKEQGKGTGLGLAVVDGIVKQHGGFIKLASQAGQGATFTIVLPAAAAPAPLAAPQPQAPARGGTETILVAEDEEILRNLAATILRRSGYTVLLTANGEEAIEIFTKDCTAIDLVILDLIMPRIGGLEAFERMRAQCPDLRALFVTGYGADYDLHGDSTGLPPNTTLLRKPYQVTALNQMVRDILDRVAVG
jgi:two-component system, cell cycle sensor histidine kinase and response regulator CckA